MAKKTDRIAVDMRNFCENDGGNGRLSKPARTKIRWERGICRANVRSQPRFFKKILSSLLQSAVRSRIMGTLRKKRAVQCEANGR